MEELDHLSRYDTLTGLRNRNAFNLAVDTLMQRRGAVGVVYADVNGLKEINDKYGHRAGDETLKRTADLLADCCGREHAYRVGGDEFLVLMPQVATQEFAERFDKVAHYEQVGKKELPRHEFYLTVKKSLQDKVNDVKIE